MRSRNASHELPNAIYRKFALLSSPSLLPAESLMLTYTLRNLMNGVEVDSEPRTLQL